MAGNGEASERPPTALVRLLLLSEGGAHACFSDGSLLALNPSAASFLLLSPDGTHLTRLTSAATSRERARVGRALHARNMLTPGSPHVVWEMAPSPCHFFDSIAPIDSVCWPAHVSRIHALRHSDGAIRILSIDRRAWLLLHPLGHSFSVCFPVLVGPLRDLPDDATATNMLSSTPPHPSLKLPEACRFVFCTQLHDALAGVPPSWAHPLSLARQVAEKFHSSRDRLSCNETPGVAQPSLRLDGQCRDDESRDGSSSAPGWLELNIKGWVPERDLIGVEDTQTIDISDHNKSARRIESSVAPLPFELPCAYQSGNGVEAGIVRSPLPPSMTSSSWRLDLKPAELLRAIGADAMSTELPSEGARALLNPYALYRMGDDPPLSMTILNDGCRLSLSASRRFWEAQGGLWLGELQLEGERDARVGGEEGVTNTRRGGERVKGERRGDATEQGKASVTREEEGDARSTKGGHGGADRCAMGARADVVLRRGQGITTYAVGAVPPVRRYEAALSPKRFRPGDNSNLLFFTSLPYSAPVQPLSATPPLTVSLLKLAELGEKILPLNEQRIHTSFARPRLSALPQHQADADTYARDDPKRQARLCVGDASELVEQSFLPGVGRFRLFGDGRVSVTFDDRTILVMHRPPPPPPSVHGSADVTRGMPCGAASEYCDWMVCDVTFPDGHRTQVSRSRRRCLSPELKSAPRTASSLVDLSCVLVVRSDFPIEGESYVHAALQFRKWATQSTSERQMAIDQELEEERAVLAELRRIERHIQISQRAAPLIALGSSAGPQGAHGAEQ
ncbi:MAG: hypothetical protein SGPRY_011641, partial [Prymnesium sp.]